MVQKNMRGNGVTVCGEVWGGGGGGSREGEWGADEGEGGGWEWVGGEIMPASLMIVVGFETRYIYIYISISIYICLKLVIFGSSRIPLALGTMWPMTTT